MSNYHKYLKYKNKYLQLNNMNLLTGGENTYQNIIFEVSKFIKPNASYKFKQNFGLKQLSNQVIELNKILFLSEMHNEITNYYMTDKIDGKRTILYLNTDKSYAISDILETIDIKTTGVCILDTEYYKNDYYIFDVMIYNGKNISKLPFEERMKYFDKFIEFDNIKIKPFLKLTDEYKSQITKFKKEKKIYKIDGIIFTPSSGIYDTMKVYKYKPPQNLTIDFLIKKYNNDISKYEIYNTNKNKILYILFCGINKRVFYKLKMKFIENYKNMFGDIDINNLPQYFPIQFQPSNNNNAFIYWSDDENLDNEVGEFGYNLKKKEWILKKIRSDRKIEVERGNYFGNNYKISELIWMSIEDPLNIENSKNDDIYFQEHENILQKDTRNYNSFVKSELFNKFKNTNWVMDLASGKGQDLFRYNSHNMKNIIFLEIDKAALEELITRKHLFSTDHKFNNHMHILIQNINLLDNYNLNIEKINNIYQEKNIDLIMCNFAFHYFVKNMKSLQNVCKLINHYLKKNGKFVFTAFDGKKIFNLLENTDEWIIKKDDKIKFGIKKDYKSKNLLPIGQKIKVLLPFSKNNFYEEYLINIDTINKELNKFDIFLESDNSFSSYLNKYKKVLSEDDKIYINLYHYYIFVKK